MNLDPAGASGFLCAQGARFLLHSSILIAAALLVARLFGRSGLARSAIYRAALLAVILAPVVSFSIERSGLSCVCPVAGGGPAGGCRHAASAANRADVCLVRGGSRGSG